MDFTPLFATTSPIPHHAIAAFIAIILGGIQFALPKGTKVHKYVGYMWVACFVFVAISSFFINEIRVLGPFSPIHLLSILALFGVYRAISFARQKRIKAHRNIMIELYVFALIITGIFTLQPGRTMYMVFFG